MFEYFYGKINKYFLTSEEFLLCHLFYMSKCRCLKQLFFLKWATKYHGVTTSVNWIHIHFLPRLALMFCQYQQVISFLCPSKRITLPVSFLFSVGNSWNLIPLAEAGFSWISSSLCLFSPYLSSFSELSGDNLSPQNMSKSFALAFLVRLKRWP